MKSIPRQPCFHQKESVDEPLSLISGFCPKHAHSYLLCVDLNWTLWTLLLSAPKLQRCFYLKTSTSIYYCVFIGPTCRKTIHKRSSVRHVWPMAHDRPVLVCSSEPVFEFVLGEVPGRLAGPTGELQSQRGPEAQLVLGAAAVISASGRTLPQPVFNQRLREALDGSLVSCDCTGWLGFFGRPGQ